MERKISLLVCILLVGVFTGCTQQSRQNVSEAAGEGNPISRELFAMDTYMTLTAYGKYAEQALDAAEQEIERLEALFSSEKEGSEIFLVNHNRTVVLSEDTAKLLKRSLEISNSTDGLFDITIYPLMAEWGFTTKEYRVPDDKKIVELLTNIDTSKITYDERKKLLSLPEGVQMDFGGIAKGYTSQKIMEIFKENGVSSGLVSLGGNVQIHGKKPDGSSFRVAIQNPNKTGEYIGIVETFDKAIITSGGYERYFEENGETFHHILDPRTGYPAKTEIASVSIVSSDGILADGLSTALFIMGKEGAISYWRKHSEEFDAVIVEENGNITITEGIKKNFSSDYKFTIESK